MNERAWNKIELRKKDKNLPRANSRVLWATNEGSTNKDIFHNFIGELATGGKHIDTGVNRYKLTSNYWWMELPCDPKAE